MYKVVNANEFKVNLEWQLKMLKVCTFRYIPTKNAIKKTEMSD